MAVSRVKHPDHLVFAEEMPTWEAFQSAKQKPAFRERRRAELRMRAQFSRTLRRYGFCEEDLWTRPEANAAELLLKQLGVYARVRQPDAVGQLLDVWDPEGPGIERLMAAVAEECVKAPLDPTMGRDLFVAVSVRLFGPLHKSKSLKRFEAHLRQTAITTSTCSTSEPQPTDNGPLVRPTYRGPPARRPART